MSILSYDEYRQLWDLTTRKPYLTGFPLHLDVELTSRCNLRCKMCFQQLIEGQRVDMDPSLFRQIVDEGVPEGLCAMKLQSRGESLLHRELIELLAYAKTRGVEDVHLTTNGLLLNNDNIQGLVEAGLDLMILSYDRPHAEAAGLSFEAYTQKMKNIVKRIDDQRIRNEKSRLKIRIQTCITDYQPDTIRMVEEENRAYFPEADFHLVNPVYHSHEDVPHLQALTEYILHPCTYLWQRLTIYADGAVSTCSRDYNCKFNRIGNLNSSDIRSLWHSPAMRDLRSRHLNSRRADFHICALCENYVIHKETGKPGAFCTGTVYPFLNR